MICTHIFMSFFSKIQYCLKRFCGILLWNMKIDFPSYTCQIFQRKNNKMFEGAMVGVVIG
jgi:hypothetical protein